MKNGENGKAIADLEQRIDWLYKRLKEREEHYEQALRDLAIENYELKQLINKGKCDESCTQGK